MSACLGWLGPCPDYGQFHGCRHASSHAGDHTCRCGSVQENGGRKIKNPYPEMTRVPERRAQDALLQQQ